MLGLRSRWLALGSRWLTLGCRWLALATTLKIFAGIVTTILAGVIAKALPCRRRALSRRMLGLRRDSSESNGWLLALDGRVLTLGCRRLALGGRLLTLGCRRLALCVATSLEIFAGIVTTILARVTFKIFAGIVTTILARVIAKALPCRRRALSRRRLALRRDSS